VFFLLFFLKSALLRKNSEQHGCTQLGVCRGLGNAVVFAACQEEEEEEEEKRSWC